MMKSTILAVFLVLVVTTIIPANSGLTPKSLNLPGLGSQTEQLRPFSLGDKIKGLLANDRLSFQNTVGINFSSSSGGNLNQYYLNTITYKAKQPLIIKAQVGLQHNLYGSPTFGSAQGGNTKLIVPFLGVLYKPRDNIQIEFQFSNRPSSYYGARGGYPY